MRPARLVLAVLAMAALSPVPVQGAFSFFGPTNPASTGSVNTATILEIGEGSDADTEYPFATVILDGGTSRELSRIYVGADEDYFGALYISGIAGSFVPTTYLELNNAGTTTEPSLQVGRAGNGYLLIEDGAWVDLTNSASDISIGDQTTGVGEADITGERTYVAIGQNLIVGNEGIGSLNIWGGAYVTTEDTSDAGITVGAVANSIGDLTVTGSGTILRSGDNLTIGVGGIGTMTVADGAIVDVDNSNSAVTTVGVNGKVVLSGGTLTLQTFNLNGILKGSGWVHGDGASSGQVTVASTARIEVGDDDLLRFDDVVDNQGSLVIEGGEAYFYSDFTNNAIGSEAAPGRVTVEDGKVTFSQGLANDGTIAIPAGASDIHGEVTNNATGSIVVARDAVATFHDAFTDNGGTLTLLAGSNALFLSDMTFSSNSTLQLALESTDDGVSPAALLSVSGTADLAGELQIEFPEDFAPELGQTYTLIEAESITGEFIPPVLPNLEGGLELGLLSTGNSILLEVGINQSGLAGDFNNDGVVDAADYTVWRDGLGVEYGPSDYDDWANNYGATAASSNSAAVPEPTAALLLAFAAAGVASRRS